MLKWRQLFVSSQVQGISKFFLSLIQAYLTNISKEKQLISYSEELEILFHLIGLYNAMQTRNIQLENNVKDEFLVIPSSLLFIVQQLIRTTLASKEIKIKLVFSASKENLEIKTTKYDKLNTLFTSNNLESINKTLSVYSSKSIKLQEDTECRTILIPKLNLQ